MSYPEEVDDADDQGETNVRDIEIGDIKPSNRIPVIPGFNIEKLINSGAMGQVYLATQESLERPVAIKVITPSLSVDTMFRQRFLKEGKIIAQLRHPHIVTIHDIGEYLDQYYMIMEYVAGGTLKDRIQKGLSAEHAATILRQLASALGHAHRQGFIHRDVKPANILFRDDDNAVLSDFGIAKAYEDSIQLTGTGLAIGTIIYMSPEQAQGKMLDGRSDLYSLGLVFFEMLTGFRPDRTPQGFIESLPSEFSQYQGILDRLLARNPNERFATAEQLMSDLDKISSKNKDENYTRTSGKIDKKTWRLFNKYIIGVVLLLLMTFLVGIGYIVWDRPVDSTLSLRVAYSYRPTDQINFRPLLNGGVLHSGDRYQIRFTPEQDGYVYVFQIDSSGSVYRLFPSEGNGATTQQASSVNPVRAGVTYFVPAEDEAFQLDDQIGHEQIYTLAFKEQNTDLENRYAVLGEARRAQDQSRLAELQTQLIAQLQKTQVGVMSVLNFKHNPRGSHEL